MGSNIGRRTSPDLPPGWVWTTLGEIQQGEQRTINPSKTPDQEFELYSVPSFDSRHPEIVTGAQIGSGKQIVEPGTVLLCKINPRINRVWVVGIYSEWPKIASTEWIPFAEQDGITPEYLCYFLQTAAFRDFLTLNVSGVGGSLMRARANAIEDYPFPLAPLPEQHRIVAEIEKQFTRLDAGVAALKRVQTNLKRYRASVLKAACEGRLAPQDPADEPADRLLARILSIKIASEQLTSPKRRAGRLWGSGFVPSLTEDESQSLPPGWTWAKVRDLGPVPDDVVQVGPMSMQSRDFAESGVPVLNVGCVQWDRFDETKLNFLPFENAQAFERYRIKNGDVLFTRSGTVGRSAVATDHHDGWLMTFHLLRVRADFRTCLPEYLRIVFEGAGHVRRQTREASIGTTRAGFNTNLLAMLDVPLPPLAEQHRIVAEVERRLSVVAEVEATVAANLARAGRLRQAVLKRAFEGRLVGREAHNEPAETLLKQNGGDDEPQ